MVVVEALMLTAIVGRVAADLDSTLQKELGLAWDVKLEMRKLRGVFSTINTALQEAEARPDYSQTMIEWLQKLHDAADDALILLDSLSSRVRPLILSSRFPFANKSARAIKNVKEKLEDIAKERVFILNAEGKEPAVAVEKSTEPSLPYSEIYEREQAKDEIVKFLFDTTHQKISVIPITGFRGIGKTTLAKLVFNDKRIREHFSNGLMKWIWVTDGINAEKIAQGIIQPLVWIPCDKLGLDQLKALLEKILRGRKFLLVLDSVWNEKEIWNKLMYILGGNHGVKIIVTTCNNSVAKIMKTTTSPYHLEGLTESGCWSIFAQIAIQGGQNMNRFYEENGWKIANKSRGVPRAAEALGRLMWRTTDYNSWSKITSYEIWSLPEEQTEIFPALRLSYKGLPLHSFRCLAYCSIFPRDYEMDKELMIKQWIGHDLIPSENIGHEAFNLLLDRFFFQPLQKDEDGRILTFKLQSLIYDIARFEMKNNINRHLCCDGSTLLDVTKDVLEL